MDFYSASNSSNSPGQQYNQQYNSNSNSNNQQQYNYNSNSNNSNTNNHQHHQQQSHYQSNSFHNQAAQQFDPAFAQHFDTIRSNPLFNAGQNILSKKTDEYLAEGSSYWRTLKEYFQVNNKFVFAKLKLICYPHFFSKTYNWARLNDKKDNYGVSLDNVSPQSLALNGPELYIPLMSFVTYVLLLGLCQGIASSSSSSSELSGKNTFSPDALIQTIWRCFLIHLIETCIIKFGISYFGYNMVYMDAFSYAGYKYVGLCLTIVAKPLGKVLTFISGLYLSLAFSYFVMKTLSALLPQQAFGAGWDSRLTVIIGISVLELIITLFFNSL